jgi:hypothetical protein
VLWLYGTPLTLSGARLVLNFTPSDAPLGAHSLLFLPEQVPYRVDSVKAYKPQQACWGSFFCGGG